MDEMGWTPEREAAFAEHAEAGFAPGRVVSQERDVVHAMTDSGPMDVRIQRGFRRTASGTASFPTVGDWIALEPLTDGEGALRAVLPRTSAFSRGQAERGGRASGQILAANVDTALLVAALDRDFNLRRVERYLALAWASGATPVILLNKADLCDDVPARIAEIAGIAGDTAVHPISARTGEGLAVLDRYLVSGQTLVLLGSSGAGKSTITNMLLGDQRQAVQTVREGDDRGRHTTVGRELFVLPGGALLIDTPGLRAVGLVDAEEGLDAAFADIALLAERCRFIDCSHRVEPGCAVRAAIASGELAETRLGSHQKLQREIAATERRSSPAQARAEERRFARSVRSSCRIQDRLKGRLDGD